MSSKEYKSQEFKKIAECLYRNGNGTYFAWIKVKGKRIKRSLKTTDQPLAKRRLRDLRNKTHRLRKNDGASLYFEDLTKQWLESIKPDLRPASHKRRSVAIKGLTPYFQGKLIKNINSADIDDWRKNRGGKKSARSHNIELETLKCLFRFACNRGILLDNPANEYKRRKETQALIRPPTREEFELLVNSLRNSSQATASGAADMVEFLAYSGMRIGEAREVLFKDINLLKGTITVTGGEGGTKNHKERLLPLFPGLKRVIEKIIQSRGNVISTSRLFEIRTPREAIEQACKRTELPKMNVHSLRHFFASNVIEEGINFKVLADWLGHSDGGVLAARTYGHLRKEFSAEMAQKMTYYASENHNEAVAAL